MKKIVLGTMVALTLSAPALAAEDFKAGDFMLRARALGVVPDEDGTVSNGAKTNIDNHVVPEVDLTYFITPNVAVEAMSPPTRVLMRAMYGFCRLPSRCNITLRNLMA